jgi:hypothetical protein
VDCWILVSPSLSSLSVCGLLDPCVSLSLISLCVNVFSGASGAPAAARRRFGNTLNPRLAGTQREDRIQCERVMGTNMDLI